MRKLDLRSYICVPLIARGKTLGAVTFASTRASGRVFSEDTVSLVEELARRAAVAIDNARVRVELEQANQRQRDTLNATEEHFRLLVEGVRDYAIFMLDPEGYVATWNAGAERFNGYKAREIIGEHFSRFYTEEDIARCHPWTELEIAAREGCYEEEGWRLRKDGRRFWASVVITALRDEQGTLRGFAKVTRDITERRLRDEQHAEARVMEQQRRFLKEVLASVTQGRLVLCDSKEDLPAPLPPFTAGGEAVVLTPGALKTIRGYAAETAEACGLPLERIQDLVTATSECCMNAVQHAGGGTARVCSDVAAGRVQVWVEDTGTGIDLSQLPRATLETGYGSGKGGIGHGFSLMIACCDRLYLLTGAGGTTAVLEQGRAVRIPSWLHPSG